MSLIHNNPAILCYSHLANEGNAPLGAQAARINHAAGTRTTFPTRIRPDETDTREPRAHARGMRSTGLRLCSAVTAPGPTCSAGSRGGPVTDTAGGGVQDGSAGLAARPPGLRGSLPERTPELGLEEKKGQGRQHVPGARAGRATGATEEEVDIRLHLRCPTEKPQAMRGYLTRGSLIEIK